MNKIPNQFLREPDGDLINKSYYIVDKTKGNPHFPDRTYVQEVEKTLNEYHTAFTNAQGGDTILVAIKNDKKVSFCKALKELADYVTRVSNGDRMMMVSSGFDLSASRGQKVLRPINGFEVEIGAAGKATSHVKRVAGARAYIHQYTTAPPTNETRWVSKTTTEREYTFTGLESGAKYWFQVIAIGFKAQEVYSPIEARFIQ